MALDVNHNSWSQISYFHIHFHKITWLIFGALILIQPKPQLDLMTFRCFLTSWGYYSINFKNKIQLKLKQQKSVLLLLPQFLSTCPPTRLYGFSLCSRHDAVCSCHTSLQDIASDESPVGPGENTEECPASKQRPLNTQPFKMSRYKPLRCFYYTTVQFTLFYLLPHFFWLAVCFVGEALGTWAHEDGTFPQTWAWMRLLCFHTLNFSKLIYLQYFGLKLTLS